MQDYISVINKQLQNKKHIIITGSRGSGKSTLLKEIVDKASTGNRIPGIITWCEPGKAVYMRMAGGNDNVIIGTYNNDSALKENKMRPVKSGFDEYGVIFLEQLMQDKSEWVLIDEIGYLESAADRYIKKLKLLFEKKRVLAVVRKQETELIKYIVNQKNSFIIDLDIEDVFLSAEAFAKA